MFEHKRNNLLPFSLFIKRVVKYFTYTLFLTTIAIFFAPIAHRILHKFHIENESTE